MPKRWRRRPWYDYDLDPETDESVALTTVQLKDKMLAQEGEEVGWQLLDLMESGEWRICERLGLCKGYRKDGVAYIDVPSWKRFVAHLKLVNGV